MGRFLWNVFTRQVTSDERPSGKITEIVNRSVRKMVIGNVLPRVISWRDKWRDIYYRESACNAPLSLIQRATLLFPLPLLVGARSIFLFSLFSFSFTSSNRLMHLQQVPRWFCYCSFVQEFASPPADGITLLLETLRGVQLAQSSPPSSGHTGPRVGTRRAALDELGCVECLAACTERCTDAPRLLVQAQPGLLALAVCLTSSLNRSRVLALQVTIVTSVPSVSLGYC